MKAALDKTGVQLIEAERNRQVLVEGYDLAHDDEHEGNELAWAAACYAAPERIFVPSDVAAGRAYYDPFPGDWSDSRCCPPSPHKMQAGNVAKPELFDGEHRIRMLVKAGALIAAEIDRLQRAVATRAQGRRRARK